MSNMLRFHLSLWTVEPQIWRRLWISDRSTLAEFHTVLQVVMGWEDCHLHKFALRGRDYGIPDGEERITDEDPWKVGDERRVTLATLRLSVGETLEYLYDFGNMWHHSLLLEERTLERQPLSAPFCTDGARSGPPEDSGGDLGFEGLLAILADPADPEFAETREWLDHVRPGFSAEAFSASALNHELTHLAALGQLPSHKLA